MAIDPVSQEILSLGNCVAATQFPRKCRRSNYAMRQCFLGNIAAIRKYCRACVGRTLSCFEVAKEFELLANKMEQRQYDRIVGYLRTGSFPSSMTKNEKDSLRRKAKNFVVKDGLLYYRDKRKAADLQVLKHALITFI